MQPTPPFIDKGYSRPTRRARELRRDATPAERKLWQRLRASQVAETRFTQQFPIGPYICDFAARITRLVIEIDGETHASLEAEAADARRTAILQQQGYTVVRFTNRDVLENIEGVVQQVAAVLADMPSPNPSRKREGS